MKPHYPTEIRLRKSAAVISVTFDNREKFELPFEYLQVFSPSAEVSGHGRQILQIRKEQVKIRRIEPVGSHAVRLVFDDGHDTGLYTWSVLYDLGKNREQNGEQYLKRLDGMGYRRKAYNSSHAGMRSPAARVCHAAERYLARTDDRGLRDMGPHHRDG